MGKKRTRRRGKKKSLREGERERVEVMYFRFDPRAQLISREKREIEKNFIWKRRRGRAPSKLLRGVLETSVR